MTPGLLQVNEFPQIHLILGAKFEDDLLQKSEKSIICPIPRKDNPIEIAVYRLTSILSIL